MVEGVYVLLNTDKNLYASIFDFTDPWKIDILEFMERNYMNGYFHGRNRQLYGTQSLHI